MAASSPRQLMILGVLGVVLVGVLYYELAPGDAAAGAAARGQRRAPARRRTRTDCRRSGAAGRAEADRGRSRARATGIRSRSRRGGRRRLQRPARDIVHAGPRRAAAGHGAARGRRLRRPSRSGSSGFSTPPARRKSRCSATGRGTFSTAVKARPSTAAIASTASASNRSTWPGPTGGAIRSSGCRGRNRRTALVRIALARLVPVALLAAVLTGCAAGSSAYKKGYTAAKVHDWDTAVAHFRTAVQDDPDKPEYRIALERAMMEAALLHASAGQGLRSARAARRRAARVPSRQRVRSEQPPACGPCHGSSTGGLRSRSKRAARARRST